MQEFVINESVLIDRDKKMEAPDFPLLPKTQALLFKLQEFLLGSSTIAIVSGPIGSGKTTLVKSLQAKNSRICHVVPTASKINFSRYFSQILNLDPSDEDDSAYAQLTTLFKITRNLYQELVLIIDDAELLGLETFRGLLQAFSQESSTKIKLILMGETILNNRINDWLEKNDSPTLPVFFRLEPLSFKETKYYLKHCLFNEVKQNQSFSKKNIKSIFDLSEGYPGRINRVALHYASKNKPAPYPKKKRSVIDVLLACGIVCLLSVLSIKVFPIVMKLQSHPPLSQPIAHAATVNSDDENSPSYIASIANLPVEVLTPPKDSEVLILPIPMSALSKQHAAH